MKKFLLLLTLSAFGFVNAQTEKGSWVVGGSTTIGFNSVGSKVDYNGGSVDGPKVSTFNFTPSVGYFVMNKLAVGLDLGFTSVSTKYNDDGSNDKYTTSTFSLMPTATYYFTTESKLFPYLGAGLGYASTKEKDNSYETKVDGFAWKGKGGVAYFITDKVAIDIGLSYHRYSNKDTYDGQDIKTKINTFGVGAGLSIFL